MPEIVQLLSFPGAAGQTGAGAAVLAAGSACGAGVRALACAGE